MGINIYKWYLQFMNFWPWREYDVQMHTECMYRYVTLTSYSNEVFSGPWWVLISNFIPNVQRLFKIKCYTEHRQIDTFITYIKYLWLGYLICNGRGPFINKVCGREEIQSTHPVWIHYLKSLGYIWGVSRQTSSSRDKSKELYPLLIAERVQNLPKPTDYFILLINSPVSATHVSKCIKKTDYVLYKTGL